MFQVSVSAVHPPAYIRFLVSAAWCRQLWGKGIWDDWEKEWKELYSPDDMDDATCEVIRSASKYIPAIAKACITTRFRRLDYKPIQSLFDLNQVQPERLQKYATTDGVQQPDFKRLSIGAQLAVFRLLRETRVTKQSVIDQYMNKWLKDIQNN